MAEQKLRVLLVEDEPSIAKTVGKRLEFAGYDVIIAADGQEGLDMAKAEQPDIIILDLMLPKLSGLKVCPLLRQDERTKAIPIVIFTSRDQVVDKETCLKSGADSFVPKAAAFEVLLSELNALLKRTGKVPPTPIRPPTT